MMSQLPPLPFPEDEPHAGTRLESVEEVRRALEHAPTVREQAGRETLPYRPSGRPPMALLGVLDDGKQDGEWLRLRADRTVLGRTQGDVQIPHDPLMSSRHAEIVREGKEGRFRWFLVDLNSTNGTFVRVNDTPLRQGQEVLVGGRRFKFEEPAVPPPPAGEEGEEGTRGWRNVSAAEQVPSLVELTPRGLGQRFLLSKPEMVLGSDRALCDLTVPDDRLMSAVHAKVVRDGKGRWRLKNAGALNGTWARVTRLHLEGACQFQLGEQRFWFRPA
jgi:pSer/pThr/pTyr-binding forkhead associated (FHA) protein